MTVRPILWTYKPRRDGSCNIKFYLSDEQGKKYVATRLYAMPFDWDKKIGRFKRTAAHWRQLNAVIEQEQNKLLGQLLGAESSLLQFIDKYIVECEQGVHNRSYNTWRQYVTHVGKLRAYCAESGLDDLSFTDIDLEFYNSYNAYLRRQGLGTAGCDHQIKILRKFLRLSYNRGLHRNQIFENPLFRRIKYKVAPKIYLDEDEMTSFMSLDLPDRVLGREQDRFIVSYFLLLRHGDSLKINRNHFFTRDGRMYFRNQAEKTGSISI
ncbi:MAG: phage integrase SAM-like domain-containing protein, partial [Bacteroidota bacterium]